jgi:hypothetical protein
MAEPFFAVGRPAVSRSAALSVAATSSVLRVAKISD